MGATRGRQRANGGRAGDVFFAIKEPLLLQTSLQGHGLLDSELPSQSPRFACGWVPKARSALRGHQLILAAGIISPALHMDELRHGDAQQLADITQTSWQTEPRSLRPLL